MTNKKKLFVVSDIHGHASLLKRALEEKGFDPQNPDHLFVCCGDCFDRGNENLAVLDFLESLPHKVLLFGNHEELLSEVIESGRIDYFSEHNGTWRTICEFAEEGIVSSDGRFRLSDEIRARIGALFSEMMDYFETERYVFVHGWVPLCELPPEREDSSSARSCGYEIAASWRNSSKEAWEQSRWLEWPRCYQYGLLLSEKTIVCGHHSAACGWRFDPSRTERDVSPFFGNRMIAIDATTVRSNEIHVLVLQDELLPCVTHSMKLLRKPFDEIVSGRKTVEMRLFDEKRREIKAGDRIVFTCEDSDGETLCVAVKGIYYYRNFDELLPQFTAAALGFKDEEEAEECRIRQNGGDDDAIERMKREKQYISAFMQKIYPHKKMDACGTAAILIRKEDA